MSRDWTADSERTGVGAVRITPAYRPEQLEKVAPCQAGCANCGDVRQWIGTIAQRAKMGIDREESYRRAWRTITEVNPFPASLGRVCPHPCEDKCNRGDKDEPLAINAMERFLGDWAIDREEPLKPASSIKRDQWIGVVGSGPAGLSFAYQMARRGYQVTVYERKERPGGMLRDGVPDFRLPQEILDAEIDRIFDLGVRLNLNCAIGRDISLEALRARHDALFLGLGAQAGRQLGIPGEHGASVWTGTEYLQSVNRGKALDCGQRVVVIGGGNSAIDAARCARRQDAEVRILYRRTRDEMPAVDHEINDALAEGVEIEFLVAPVRIERNDDGLLTGLVALRMKLGDKDDSGRRKPVPIPSSEFHVPCDTVISAISQHPVLDGLNGLAGAQDWLVTDEFGSMGNNIYAGGDALSLGIAGNAIMQGRLAAEQLHFTLSGEELPEPVTISDTIDRDHVKLDYKPIGQAARELALPVEARVTQDAPEVVSTMSEQQFLDEAERCFSCGSCFGCEQCSMYCTNHCFTRLEEVSPGSYFSIQLDQCHECGKCIEVCPSGFLEISRVDEP